MTVSNKTALPIAGYQGEPGAFSEAAARQLLPEGVSLVPCATFDDLFNAFRDNKIEFMVAPVENSIAGTVELVMSLLQANPHVVVNEIGLPIIQSLIGIPGAKFEDVQTAESHPVAIAQCKKFFAKNPEIRAVEKDDTAASVRRIMEAHDPSRAAIGSVLAAELYGANILLQGIQDEANNTTRFLLIKKKTGATQ